MRFMTLQMLFAMMFFLVVWVLPERNYDANNDYSMALSSKTNKRYYDSANSHHISPSFSVSYRNSNDPLLVRVLFRTHTGRSKRWHHNQNNNGKEAHKMILLPRLAHGHISQTVKQITDILLYSTTESLTLITMVWLEREG